MKRLLYSIISFFLLTTTLQAQKFEGLALTPPMGWNSWNKFGGSISEDIVKQVADAIVNSGLKEAGYEYVILDDHWHHSERDANGNLQPNPDRFPSGMKALGDYIHSKGLKFGIYSDAGTMTCGLEPGSKGYEYQDARTFAEWGVDYLKYDWCHSEGLDQKEAYTLMRDAIYAAGRPVVFNLCEWGTSNPWEWGKEVGHLWRTGSDIWNCFDCEHQGESLSIGVMQILDKQDPKYRKYGGPDGWNDADMMQVGNGMPENENRAHFSMWVMLSSPLILGNDVRNMTAETLITLSNKEAIAINQDALGIRGLKHSAKDDLEVWFKPLSDGDWAVCFLNRSTEAKTINIDWNDYVFTDEVFNRATDLDKISYNIRDIWTHKNIGTTSTTIMQTIPGRDVFMIRLYKSEIPEMPDASLALRGSGTQEDPYQIRTPEHLYSVRGYLNNPNVYFKLMNDIDLQDFLESTVNGWQPIGSEFDNAFIGNFDGNGKTIKNLWITNNGNNNGLFGVTKTPASIKNLTIEDVNFNVGGWSGMLIGMNGNWEFAGGVIDNCHIKKGSIKGFKCVGGLMGVNAGIITNSSAIDINVAGTSDYIGGLVGENNSNNGALYVKNCTALGVVQGDGEAIGGLFGLNRIIFIENCYSYCDVIGGKNCGGIIGYNNGGARVNKCFAFGNIEGKSAGGVVGDPQTAEMSNCYFMGSVLGFPGQDVFSGGLNGAAYDCKFTNCYFNGILDGTARDRAMTGRAIRINFTNCYFNSTLSGSTSGYQDNENSQGTIIDLTDGQMQKTANFAGLLSADEWSMWDDNSYPFLSSQTYPVKVMTAKTNEFSGSYKGNAAQELIFFTQDEEYGITALYPNTITNSGNSWNASFSSTHLPIGQQVFVIAKETNLNFSYPVEFVIDTKGDEGTSIEDNELSNKQLTIQYTPNKDGIFINIDGLSSNPEISIFDATGKKVFSKDKFDIKNKISIETFSKGVHIVKVKSSEIDASEKFIVN